MAILVGDQVGVDVHADGTAVITNLLPRRSVLTRRIPGRAGRSRGVAANLDQVVVVGAASQPPWEPQLMDRFLAVAEASELTAVLVINKCDLDPGAESLGDPYRAAGYEVVLTSVVSRIGLLGLAERLAHRTSLFTGPTGVGKSSLLNELQPGLGLRTGPVSVRKKTGRHTTVAAEMHAFGDDGFVVDTPGLRDVGMWGLEPRDIAASFPDVMRLASACRFDNCRHSGEPDCAVQQAAAAGRLAPGRLASYRQLLAEAQRGD
jgi:ribosome biogenesis GTPase